VIDHDKGYMQSRELTDVYATNDPQNALDRRIKFCMELHKDAVKALDYPLKEDKRDFGDLDEEKS
jgi:26S proteasome regulatory subunit N3